DHGIFILTTDRRFRTISSRKDVEQALAGVPLREFTGPEDLLSQIPKGFLPFDLADISGFEERFSEEWNKFRETDLFRRITGLKCLADVLRKFKIEKLYDWQKTVIDNVLNGVPAQFVVQPPGGGKSLTYQIPAMMRPGLTLVISPLKALMQDQVLSLKKRGITGAEFYNSNLSPLTRREIFARVDSGEIRLLYVAPERLYKSFIEKILKLKQGVSMLVIDEAHMISEAGSQWRPFYGELKHAWEQFGKPQLLVLTATAGKKIREDIQKQFGIPDEYVFLRSTVREHIRISAENVTNPNMGTSVEDQKARALEFVKRAKGSPVLIYCSWINYIYDLKSYLDDFFIRNMLSVQVEVYHTGPDLFGNVIDSGELHKRHLRFLSNETQVLIATSAYGMGIDKPDIWGVLFNNMPASLEELVQGWGRVCRDPDKLREYLEAKHPPEVSVTYNVKDWRERENQISGNFRTISEWQEDILNTHGIRWHLALNSAAPLEYSCQAGTFFKDSTWAGRDLSRTDVLSSDRLDEDKLCACLLMARYMRENAMLSDFEFDWKSSVFRFKGVSGCPKAEKLEGLLGKCNLEQQKKLDKVEEFCLTKKCRNEFLEEYFAAPRPKSKCMLCDNCRGPVPGAYEGYTEFLHEKADENVRHHFVRGVFGGGDAAFLQYLQGIPEDELSVQTAYLDREHLESGQEHSDAECAAILLELKQDKAEPEKVIQRIVRLVEGDFPRLRDRGREAIFFPFARECGIPQPEELWESISFICGNRETAGPDRVTWRFLAECKDHEKRMNLAGNDPAYREALEKWIVGNAPSELGEFILKSEFRACVYYICRGLALKKLLSENEDDGSWSTLAKYLKKIVKWEKEDKTKFRYLCDLTEHLPAKEKEEWDRILIAPEDYLKMAEADPELFGPEKYWEPEWFCNSVLAGSELARCVDNRENILLSETETAAGRMPMESWRDLLDWMPCTAKLYPAWKEMLEKIREKDLHVQFSDPASVPAEIAAYCTELPPALKDFLKREVFFGNDPKWLEKLSDLSVDAGKTSAKGGRKG
ncbi:MAG: RecQ family ATP-dependent DNA helicase, partial [Lentisphaeria bacterium]|nr:RecQ family ATP-dependent DNA helicase [Lentisphaeria bacterium]